MPLAIGFSAINGLDTAAADVAIAAGNIIATTIVLRGKGVLAAICSIAFFLISNWTPFLFSSDAPMASRAFVILGAFMLLAVYGFVLSLGGKPLLGSALVEDGAAA
jgi:hypothetical protein